MGMMVVMAGHKFNRAAEGACRRENNVLRLAVAHYGW